MKRNELFLKIEGIQLLIDNWQDYFNSANEALERVININTELESCIFQNKVLSNNSITHLSGFKRINNMMGIFTNDLHEHIKMLNSGLVPNYPSSYISKLKDIDNNAQKWKKIIIKLLTIIRH